MALCPEPEQGPPQAEDVSPRFRSRYTLRERFLSCHAGSLCTLSIGLGSCPNQAAAPTAVVEGTWLSEVIHNYSQFFLSP